MKRSVVIRGKKTSVSLEDEFWAALHRIAKAESATIAEIAEGIRREDKRNLSSALRVFILRYHEKLVGLA